jgi:superfamily I DNA/RNA helicase
LVRPEDAGRSGDAPLIKALASLEDEVAFTLHCLQVWQNKGIAWHDIAILYPGGHAGTTMAKALKKADIPFFWLASSDNKKKYRPDENRVSLMPIPSSKGLEFDRVIILDSTFIPASRVEQAAPVDEEVRRLYVGLTRAKSHLVISYHRQNALSEALQLSSALRTAAPSA